MAVPRILRAIVSDERDNEDTLNHIEQGANEVFVDFDCTIVPSVIQQAALSEAIVEFMKSNGVILQPYETLSQLDGLENSNPADKRERSLGFTISNLEQLEIGEGRSTIVKMRKALTNLINAAEQANDEYQGFTREKR